MTLMGPVDTFGWLNMRAEKSAKDIRVLEMEKRKLDERKAVLYGQNEQLAREMEELRKRWKDTEEERWELALMFAGMMILIWMWGLW